MSKNRTRYHLKRVMIIAGIITLVGVLALMVLSILLTNESVSYPEIVTIGVSNGDLLTASTSETSALRVMSLNLAHGRKEGPNQVFQSRASIEGNLSKIVDLFQRLEPDVVAVQEANGPSFWSGNFDHAFFLASNTPFHNYARGDHARGLGIAYGTGFLSDLPLQEILSVTFNPSPAMAPRGFTVASVEWPPDSGGFIDVVSVHLDVTLQSRRNRQVDEMIHVISPRNKSVIIMGDFNTDWQAKDSAVHRLAEGLDLRAYQPAGDNLWTFRSRKTRLDWILISKEMTFTSYRVLPDRVSDHSAVFAEIELISAP